MPPTHPPPPPSLERAIARHRFITLTIVRQIASGHRTSAKSHGADEDNERFGRATCSINIAPLLYPGTSRVVGSFLLHAIEVEQGEAPPATPAAEPKTKRKGKSATSHTPAAAVAAAEHPTQIVGQ